MPIIRRDRGWVPIVSKTAVSDPALSFLTHFNANKYKDYRFIGRQILPETDLTSFRARVSLDGSTTRSTANDYWYAGTQYVNNAHGAFANSTATEIMLNSNARVLSNVAGEEFNFRLDIMRPHLGNKVWMEFECQMWDGTANTPAGVFAGSHGRFLGTSGAVLGVEFACVGGDFSGTIDMLGLAL